MHKERASKQRASERAIEIYTERRDRTYAYALVNAASDDTIAHQLHADAARLNGVQAGASGKVPDLRAGEMSKQHTGSKASRLQEPMTDAATDVERERERESRRQVASRPSQYGHQNR
jgi:hypothetical protein